MKKLIAALIAGVFILSACSPSETQAPASQTTETQNPGQTQTEQINSGEALDDMYSDKTEVTLLYTDELTTCDYLKGSVEIEMRIAANCEDALVEYDKYGVVQPGLAESWSVSDDGTVYTFKIRQGVKWVSHDGNVVADVTANDFVSAAEYVLDQANANENANLLYSIITNGEEFYNGEVTDFSQVGITAVDDHTLQYTLLEPTPYFISMLTYNAFFPVYGPFLEEMGEDFGIDNTSLLYCGAYIFSDYQPQAKQTFTKNPTYWDTDKVYIEKISYTYNKEAVNIEPEMYLRGEITTLDPVPATLLGEWMADPAKANLIRPGTGSFYTYFYAFNFDPKFDAQYEPDNWKIAVNNENFRKSIAYALDRVSLSMTSEPYTPAANIINSVTPPDFTEIDGVDYTQMGELKDLSAKDTYNPELAKQFRDLAIPELEAAGCTFPIKILQPYNPNTSTWDKRAVILEQSVEKLLGTDYVDIIVEAGPSSGFLADVRRAGKYALLECNWGPDYADPQTYTDPFSPGEGTYNWPEKIIGDVDANGEKMYTNLLNAAKAEKLDINKRYEAFAKAEAFLIEKCYIVPYKRSAAGFIGSYLNPFEAMYSPFGVSYLRYKGQHLLKVPMNSETFENLKAEWLVEKAAAQKAANH